MKKFILLLGITLIFLGLSITEQGLHSPSLRALVPAGAEYIQYQADGGIVTGEYAPAGRTWYKSGLRGESVAYAGGKEDALAVIKALKAEVIKTEESGGVTCWYCRASGFPESVRLGGRTVNLQIAVSSGIITLGSPLILGSY